MKDARISRASDAQLAVLLAHVCEPLKDIGMTKASEICAEAAARLATPSPTKEAGAANNRSGDM